MAVFCLKNLQPLQRVGERFKEARQENQLTLEEVAVKTRIPMKYLEAIEAAHFNELPPAKAHRLAYIREYAQALNLNPASFMYQFSKEASLNEYRPTHPRRGIALWRFSSLSHVMRVVLIAALVVSFIGYLAWQINRILQPPTLAVYAPAEGYVSRNLSVMVQGQTEKEVRLTVNGKEIMANENGHFEAPVDLSNGVNTITISAVKKHGKTTTVTRHIMVKVAGSDSVGLNQ